MSNTADFVVRLRDKLSGAAGKMGRSVGALHGKMTTLNSKFSKGKWGDSFKAQALKVAKYAGVAALAIGGLVGKSIVETGAGYEEAISAVGAVGLQTREQISALDEKAKQLGAETKFTATEAANAMQVMAQAGFKNQEILSGVGAVLSAAAASGLEIAEVAGYVSDSLKGMGLAADQATRVADVLAVASSRTNSTIGSLGESMKNVSGTARDLGVSLEETVAGVALLQDVGLDASVAGSAMNVMLTRISKPTGAAAQKMKEFGVSFKDAKGDMLPFADVLANISSAAEQSGGNMDKVAFLADLVGLRGQKAATKLARLFDEGRVEKLTRALQNSDGMAKKMADLRMDNLLGDWEKLTSAVDAVKIAIFETQSGALRKFISGLTDWVAANEKLITSKAGAFISAIGDALWVAFDAASALAGAFFDVWLALLGGGAKEGESRLESIVSKMQYLAEWVTVNRDLIVTLATAFGYLAAAATVFMAVAKVIPVVTALFKGLWFVGALLVKGVMLLVATFGIIPVAIGAAVIAAVALVWYFWDEISAAFGAAWTWLSGWFSQVGSDFVYFGESMMKGLVDGIMRGVQWVKDAVTNAGRSVLEAARDVFGINSPSKEFEWIGKMNMVGAERGTEQYAPLVERQTEQVANDTKAAGSGSGGSNGGGRVIQLKPTLNFYGGASAEDQKAAAGNIIDQVADALEAMA